MNVQDPQGDEITSIQELVPAYAPALFSFMVSGAEPGHTFCDPYIAFTPGPA